jgi:hypothetical protein
VKRLVANFAAEADGIGARPAGCEMNILRAQRKKRGTVRKRDFPDQ